jgi:Chemotaxis protein; stimulates methylation of MCP proteins
MSPGPGKDDEMVIVGIGDFCVGKMQMSSIGLGSCIGLVIFDKDKGIGGMAHVMLPDSQGRGERPGKFADTAVEALTRELVKSGSRQGSLVAKIAGGAAMFKTFSGNLNIGERNIEAVKAALKLHNIPLAGEDTRGVTGRTMVYIPGNSGKISIKTADGTRKEI